MSDILVSKLGILSCWPLLLTKMESNVELTQDTKTTKKFLYHL